MQSRLSRGLAACIVGGFNCVRFAPGKLSLSMEFSPAILAVPEWWLCSWESQMDQMEGMKMGEPYLLPFQSARPVVLPPGERARRSACLSWTGRMSMSFRKAYCLHKHIVN